jgi:hexosaminidase
MLLILLLLIIKVILEYDIIPYPQFIETKTGHFEWKNMTTIIIPIKNETFIDAVSFLSDLITRSSGVFSQILVINDPNINKESYIKCIIDDVVKEDEGYLMQVSEGFITIKAKKVIGIFYAFQTLRQMLPVQIESTVPALKENDLIIQCCIIKDYPRFKYRGFMLDVCRHWSDHINIMRYLDILSMHKFNNFHFHLTEGLVFFF